MAGASATRDLTLSDLAAELRSYGIDPATLDYSRGLRAVDVYLGAQAKENFDHQATPDGQLWPPFKRKPSKRRGGWSAKLLRDKGLMMASMSARAAGTLGAVREITPLSLEHGSNLDYAATHNYGDPSRNIPAREFSGITDVMATRIEELIADDVARQLGF